MPDIESQLSDNRAAVAELVAAAERCEDRWTESPAPGKWSPSQLVEHIALSYEEAGEVVAGRPTKLPSFPAFVRPVGKLFFKLMLRRQSIPRSKTTKPMDPIEGSATLGEAKARLESCLQKFETECRTCAAAGGVVNNPAFGRIAVGDYAAFVALHTRHHVAQLPG